MGEPPHQLPRTRPRPRRTSGRVAKYARHGDTSPRALSIITATAGARCGAQRSLCCKGHAFAQARQLPRPSRPSARRPRPHPVRGPPAHEPRKSSARCAAQRRSCISSAQRGGHKKRAQLRLRPGTGSQRTLRASPEQAVLWESREELVRLNVSRRNHAEPALGRDDATTTLHAGALRGEPRQEGGQRSLGIGHPSA